MAVCIAGMHRSGTSMVAKILHASALYLGPEADLLPRNPGVAEGHWENKRFVKINAGIISTLYGSWDAPPEIPVDGDSPRLASFRGEAGALLATFDGHEPWGWKDPRNCLTLPFWQSLLDPLPVIIVVRNPLEVAKSLRERNGFSLALGLALWKAYNQRLCAAAVSNRIVTHYETFFQDPEGEFSRLLDFLGIVVDDEAIARMRAVHDPQLRHHRLTTADLRAAAVDPAIIDVYADLCREANWVEPTPGLASATAATSRVDGDDWDDPDASAFVLSREARLAKSGRPNRRQRPRRVSAAASIS